MAIQAQFVDLRSQASRHRWPPGPGSRDTLAAHPPAAVGRAQLAAAPSAPPPGRKCGAATVPPQPSAGRNSRSGRLVRRPRIW